MLAGAADPQRLYIETILPKKLRLYREYVQTRTMSGDIGIILKTLRKIFWR
jgi:lipopolysaccharide/colanic/teichoic acid biosynthesis glycosyltransferase